MERGFKNSDIGGFNANGFKMKFDKGGVINPFVDWGFKYLFGTSNCYIYSFK